MTNREALINKIKRHLQEVLDEIEPAKDYAEEYGLSGGRFPSAVHIKLDMIAGYAREAMEAAAALQSPAEGWRPISDEARTGASVLVYGLPQAIEGVAFRKPAVFTAHWDQIDNSFCLDGGTWLGPFIEPTHWMPKPTPPEGK